MTSCAGIRNMGCLPKERLTCPASPVKQRPILNESKPYPIDLADRWVVASGNGWLVLEKPCGLSIHNDPGNDLCAVATRLSKQKHLRQNLSCDPLFGIHAVNRLDRDTSGLVLMACRQEVFSFLSKQFELKKVTKTYMALVHGDLKPSCENCKWSKWEQSLGKKPGGRNNPKGVGKQMQCKTLYRVMDKSRHYTFIECRPVTGKKHQIRRHAKLAGHPVTGDRRYGSPRSVKYLAEQCNYNRLGLHSKSLTLMLPGEKNPRTFRSRTLPKKMMELLQNDR